MSLYSDAELAKPNQGRINPRPQDDIAQPNVIKPNLADNLDAPNDLDSVAQQDIGGVVNRAPQSSQNIDAPVDRAPVADAGLDAPNTITPNPADTIGLNHGRIGYVNEVFDASLSATSGNDTAIALSTQSTWERWTPTSGGAQSVTATFDSNKPIDYVGLAGYDLEGASVTIEYSASTTGSFNVIKIISNFENQSVMTLFSEVSARRIRLTISRTSAVNLGVFYAGKVLELQRAIRGGTTPANLNQQTSYSNEFSIAGQILGRVINREGIETSVPLKNLTDDWYRTYFLPFAKSARTTAFFYLWNPRDYPLDCIYGGTDNDMKPTLQGGKKFMDISFSIEGI